MRKNIYIQKIKSKEWKIFMLHDLFIISLAIKIFLKISKSIIGCFLVACSCFHVKAKAPEADKEISKSNLEAQRPQLQKLRCAFTVTFYFVTFELKLRTHAFKIYCELIALGFSIFFFQKNAILCTLNLIWFLFIAIWSKVKLLEQITYLLYCLILNQWTNHFVFFGLAW